MLLKHESTHAIVMLKRESIASEYNHAYAMIATFIHSMPNVIPCRTASVDQRKVHCYDTMTSRELSLG